MSRARARSRTQPQNAHDGSTNQAKSNQPTKANLSLRLASPKETQPKKRTEGATHTTFRTN